MKPSITIIKDKFSMGRTCYIISINGKETGSIQAMESYGIKGTSAYSIIWLANWKQKLFPAGEALTIECGERTAKNTLKEVKLIAKNMIIEKLAEKESA